MRNEREKERLNSGGHATQKNMFFFSSLKYVWCSIMYSSLVSMQQDLCEFIRVILIQRYSSCIWPMYQIQIAYNDFYMAL